MQWFYELKNKEENEKYGKFGYAFDLIYSNESEKVKEGLDTLKAMQHLFLGDEPFNKLLEKAELFSQEHRVQLDEPNPLDPHQN